VSDSRRLEGRRVVVTGAAAGIGLAIARLFVQHGAKVAALDSDSENVSREWSGVAAVPVDVSDEAAVRAAIDTCAKALGGLDGVVNAAGISLKKPFDETSASEWRRVLAVNLDGPFNVCHAALAHLKAAGGGTIVNISSGAGLRPLPQFTAYCASKGGLVMFSKALAIDLAGDNVRVNVICPGVIDTPMIQRRLAVSEDREATIENFLRGRLMHRFGTPEEIADSALFLTSAESSFITGAALAVDGGAVFH
jgi:NAD(P)-dependent dehydrogenase (short-subunit alcohol dehydrogenase family)